MFTSYIPYELYAQSLYLWSYIPLNGAYLYSGNHTYYAFHSFLHSFCITHSAFQASPFSPFWEYRNQQTPSFLSHLSPLACYCQGLGIHLRIIFNMFQDQKQRPYTYWSHVLGEVILSLPLCQAQEEKVSCKNHIIQRKYLLSSWVHIRAVIDARQCLEVAIISCSA